jgi:hypothetical protein
MKIQQPISAKQKLENIERIIKANYSQEQKSLNLCNFLNSQADWECSYWADILK